MFAPLTLASHYRLPPGFVLKSQKKEREEAEKALEISLEDFLETARHQLGTNLTPVTAESFAEWKQKRKDKKAAEEDILASKKGEWLCDAPARRDDVN